jgi:hypothetical protein
LLSFISLFISTFENSQQNQLFFSHYSFPRPLSHIFYVSFPFFPFCFFPQFFFLLLTRLCRIC